MTQNDYVLNLKETMLKLEETLRWLKRSFNICKEIGIKEKYTEKEFDSFETLTSRFARTIDILIHKLFRSIDAVEFESEGTMIDVINRAHKRNLFESIDQIRLLKELRNEIAHEYVQDALISLFTRVLDSISDLLIIIENTHKYIQKYLK